jgi:hypothetical protein
MSRPATPGIVEGRPIPICIGVFLTALRSGGARSYRTHIEALESLHNRIGNVVNEIINVNEVAANKPPDNELRERPAQARGPTSWQSSPSRLGESFLGDDLRVVRSSSWCRCRDRRDWDG